MLQYSACVKRLDSAVYIVHVVHDIDIAHEKQLCKAIHNYKFLYDSSWPVITTDYQVFQCIFMYT